MGRRFKVYIYPDGDPNMFYQTLRKLIGKYTSEGYFFKNIRESKFRKDNPDQADLFFIPISWHKMRGKGGINKAKIPNLEKRVVRENNVEEELSDLYHSPEIFRLTYAEMVRRFKVYIYLDGDPNTFYQMPRKLIGKYASEGYFFQNIRESKFCTDDRDLADRFFISISFHKMRWNVRCVQFFHRRL
ncbi:unnamed protein product [Ilex paraguariensis]|uniref:Uncharacterized protein n=1 Tax=Ilex paraguariensis TaxID=185542 RepID=A0ABC8T3W4_9AQUA